MPAADDSQPSSGNRWLYNAPTDLLFGCGGLYLLLFAAFVVFGASLRTALPTYLLPLLLMLVSVPHYGATLLRVYESEQQRRRYAFFSLHATAALAVLFIVTVHSPLVGSLVTTLYLAWSPWHYMGQNYGLALMFLRRNSIAVPANFKRTFYASFFLSFLTFLFVYHRAVEGRPSLGEQLGTNLSGAVPLYLGLPVATAEWLIPATLTGYIACSCVSVWQLLTAARWQVVPLLPAVLLMFSQAIWFSVPFSIEFFAPQLGIEVLDFGSRLPHYIIWVALAHALQYLWVTSYYARSTTRWRGQRTYYGKVLLAGTGIWAIPTLLFAPDAFGSLSYDADLGLAVVALVNLHHFVLDGVIWKLRHSKIGNVLIRDGSSATSTDAAPGTATLNAATTGTATPNAAASTTAAPNNARPIDGVSRVRLGPIAWALCSLALFVEGYRFYEFDVNLPQHLASERWGAAGASLDRLRWIGRDDATYRRTIARGLYQQGAPDQAVRHYRRSLELHPVATRSAELASMLESLRKEAGAREYYDLALKLDPTDTLTLTRSADFELRHQNPAVAVERYRLAVQLEPDNQRSQIMLGRAVRYAEQFKAGTR